MEKEPGAYWIQFYDGSKNTEKKFIVGIKLSGSRYWRVEDCDGIYTSDQLRIGKKIEWLKSNDEWIGFEKELPPVMLEVIVKDSSEKKRKRVFIPLDNGDVKYLAETFTHWRPVERV